MNYNELINGFMSGIGQSIIAHPIDTYKTWVQVKRKETLSLRGLYRGFAYPTIFNSLISGIAFKTYEVGKKSHNSIVGGFYAGVVTGILSSWVEYKKITAQLESKNKFNYQCIGTMLIREIPACICYYPVYDFLREQNLSVWVSGGIAGVTCWTSSYWADTINTYVMSGYSVGQLIKKLHFADYFRGIGICIPRAFIINASGYTFYELSKTYIK
jgi:solute carrier family 25 carnitine/acylcarnitine transporter 20/29